MTITEFEIMECRVCKTEITYEEVSQYAAYGGLPSPCCVICFEVNDFRIKSLEELQVKSLLKRAENTEKESKEKLTETN